MKYNQFILFSLAASLCFVASSKAAVPKLLSEILQRLEKNNLEIQLAELNYQSKTESLLAAKSYLYPSLGVNGIYSKGSSLTAATPTSDLSQYGGGNSYSSNASSLANANEGWSASLSTNYYVFSGYIISDGVERAERELKSSQIRLQNEINSQKSRYIQALLEWQWLKETIVILKGAENALKKVVSHKQNAQFLYSEEENLSFEEKKTYFVFQKTKATESIKLVEDFLLTTLPNTLINELALLPRLQVKYEIPDSDKLESLYIEKSLSRKTFDLELDNALGIQNVTNWQKPFIPTALISAGTSTKGTNSTSTSDSNWSAQIILSFNLFDGFATSARSAQARLGVQLAKNQRKLETEKKILYLKHQIMKTKVSLADSEYKKILAQQKKIKLKDIQTKNQKGIATSFEVSLAAIDLMKSKNEALDSVKDYQSAMLSIANELNEFEKVEFYDENK